MKVLVIGGLGYLGHIVTDIICRKGNFVDVIDNMLWGGIEVRDTEMKRYYKHNIFNSYKSIADNYDKVIWCCDIDVSQFYSLPISREYVDNNLEAFDFISHVFKEKLLYVGEYYCGSNTAYIDFMTKKREIALANNSSIIWLPDMYGSSNRTRLDTFLNNMFFSAYVNGIVVISNLYDDRPVIGVWYAGLKIAEFMDKENFEISPCNYMMSNSEYAMSIKELFIHKEKNIDIMIDKDVKLESYFTESLPNVQIHDPEGKGIKESYTYMLQHLEHDKGSIQDILKDKNNNSTILLSYGDMPIYKFLSNLKGS